jgi:FkbM family methyltransferase
LSKGATPRGLVARLRHQVGPLLPKFLRHAGSRVLQRVEATRGGTYEIAGERVRFLSGSAPTVAAGTADERTGIDALQLTRFAEAIRAGDVVADVGAYRGTYTIIAAARVGSKGKVFAFEPTASNADAIAANVRLNAFDNRVVIEPAAVSAETGTAQFFAWGEATTNSLAVRHSDAATVEVRTVALDDYFSGQALPRVLKIDIEGAEILALRGAQRILASDARIICELHPYAWNQLQTSAEDLRALLQQHGRFVADLVTGDEVGDFRYGAVELCKRR